MSCLFTSCFGKKPTPSHNDPRPIRIRCRSHPENLKSRRVLVRTSSEKQIEPFTHLRSSAQDPFFFADEKLALNDHDRDSLLCGYDEDREEYTSLSLSEKQVEASYDRENAVVTEREEEVVEKHLFHRRGILYKPKKKNGKAGSPPPLESQHTGDELQRRLDIERKIKKMGPKEAEKEWELERARRRQWEVQRKSAKAL